MADIERLCAELLASELETARDLYRAARSAGYPAEKAASLVYRAGRLAGRAEVKGQTKDAYRKLEAAQERVKVLESSRPDSEASGQPRPRHDA